MNHQEDLSVADTSSLDTNADLASPVFVSHPRYVADIYSEQLDRATSIVWEHTGHDQLRHHIQKLQERLDQQGSNRPS